MRFRSSHPLFGRSWNLQADAAGAFTIKGHIDDGGSSMPVPAVPFTLHGRHPQTGIEIDVAGEFTESFSGNLALAAGHATASTFYDYYTYYLPQNAIDADPWSQNLDGH